VENLTATEASIRIIFGVAFAVAEAPQVSIFAASCAAPPAQIRDIHEAKIWVMHPYRNTSRISSRSRTDCRASASFEGVTGPCLLQWSSPPVSLTATCQVLVLDSMMRLLVGSSADMYGNAGGLRRPDAVLLD